MIILILTFALNLFAADLEIWTSSENVRDALNEIKGSFEKNYNKKIKILVLNKDLTNQFKTAALSGKGPDILVWAHDVVGELAESGLLEPITIPPTLKKELHPTALMAFTYKGQVYGYPYALEAVALICNKNLVPNAPTSMEELKNLASSFPNKNGENFGFLYDIQSLFFSHALLSFGDGYIFKNVSGTLNTNDIGLTGESFVQGIQFLKSLIDEKIVPSSIDRGISFTKMKEGKLGCTIDGPWAIRELIASGIPFYVTPIPTLQGKITHPFVGSQGFLLRRGSKNRDLAFEFIEKAALTFEGISSIYRLDPRIPARIDVTSKFQSDSVSLKAFNESATVGIPMPNIPQMGAVWSAMGPAINLSLTGKSEINIALKNALDQVRTSLQK